MVKKKASVFISGNGTNLKALIQNSKNYNFPIIIDYVVSSDKNAKGLKIAKLHNIKSDTFNPKIKLEENKILEELKKRKITLICLAGYMNIISKNFIKKFNGKIINIHPSLLPKHKGLNTFSKAIKSKDKYTGCTVHYVNEKIDDGKIILQRKVLINKNDNENTLKFKVQKEEYKAYSEAILMIFKQPNF
jgi:phosphoribosylglycinamide formyltransferase 1